jgi:hypothetical protein
MRCCRATPVVTLVRADASGVDAARIMLPSRAPQRPRQSSPRRQSAPWCRYLGHAHHHGRATAVVAYELGVAAAAVGDSRPDGLMELGGARPTTPSSSMASTSAIRRRAPPRSTCRSRRCAAWTCCGPDVGELRKLVGA